MGQCSPSLAIHGLHNGVMLTKYPSPGMILQEISTSHRVIAFCSSPPLKFPRLAPSPNVLRLQLRAAGARENLPPFPSLPNYPNLTQPSVKNWHKSSWKITMLLIGDGATIHSVGFKSSWWFVSNPSEKYYCSQIGSFPQGLGWK